MLDTTRKRRSPKWDRGGLAGYLAAVVTVTCVHDPRWLAAGLGVVALLAGRDLPAIARRAVLATVLFSGVVSVSYALAGWLRGDLSPAFLLRLNLRVLLLTSMSFLLTRRIDVIRALAWTPSAERLILLTHGQILTFRRIVQDFALALKSRSPARPRWRDHYRQRAAMATFFVEKSLRDAQEITMAMTARGVFLDRDA